jgi:CO/xanthine dehydrogenase Mo-binding subunit
MPAAQVREILLGAAATRLGVNADQLKVENGTVLANDGRRLRYGELVTDDLLHVEAQPRSPLKQPGTFMVMGKPMARVDMPELHG